MSVEERVAETLESLDACEVPITQGNSVVLVQLLYYSAPQILSQSTKMDLHVNILFMKQ